MMGITEQQGASSAGKVAGTGSGVGTAAGDRASVHVVAEGAAGVGAGGSASWARGQRMDG